MHTQTYYDLLDAFPKQGCAICALVLNHTHHYIDSILYEAVLDLNIHKAVRARRGLCNQHSWQLPQFNGVQLGVAILYEAALDEVLGEMKHISTDSTGQAGLGRWLGNQNRKNAGLADKLDADATCMVCESVERAEVRFLETLTEHINEEAMQTAYQESEGLCLPHFRKLLGLPHSTERLGLIVSIQKGIWSRLQAELKELIRKSDVQYSHEEKGEEMESWLWAIRQLVGEKGVFGVDR